MAFAFLHIFVVKLFNAVFTQAIDSIMHFRTLNLELV